MAITYAELHCISNFTFLRGASHAEELVARAVELGYSAIAITDECSLAGVVRAHMAAKSHGMKLIIGSELMLADGLHVVVLAMNRAGYGRLSALITTGRRAAEKGAYALNRADLADGLPDCLVLWLPVGKLSVETAQWLLERFSNRIFLAAELLRTGQDRRRLNRLTEFAQSVGLPLVAAGSVHMHVVERQILQDVLTAIRCRVNVQEAGRRLYSNGERHLRAIPTLARIYPADLLARTVELAERCQFSLDELRYEYPSELVPPGQTLAAHLRSLTEAGMTQRWPDGVPSKVAQLIEHELTLIDELNYAPFFLTVHDIVTFARSRDILCQGRGSAANSAVCYCLGITEVDPSRMEMLFERFISKERGEPPDIDVDFEHERREEVIQYIYQKYSRERAALAAAVTTYRPRSAMRDVSKALGFGGEDVERLAKACTGWDGPNVREDRLVEAGFDPNQTLLRHAINIANSIIGFPRHLSQHVGGFVISRGPLSELVPVENAAMPERTVIQWDKDDLEALGLLKVDILALGMLTAIQRCFKLIRQFYARSISLSDVTPEDPHVYRMIRRADTVGVFQIESRAQMAMLPRLRPRTFYDLVIEISIVRPGPIQGNMVHPYLRRRCGQEPVTYASPALRDVLERTLGVPIFQEQVIKLAMVAAGFTGGEADQLRRAMAAWKKKGGLEHFEARLINGMCARGYEETFAQQIFEQIKGFGEYGFPESHAASFALLVYVSAWLKCHYPAAFTCALLNSQPMGFYGPDQLVRDARQHGVEVRPVDIHISSWDCSLELDKRKKAALRLGLRQIKGFSFNAGQRLLNARATCRFTSVDDLAYRAQLNRKELDCLAAANALLGLVENRHEGRWRVLGVQQSLPLFASILEPETPPVLPTPSESDNVVADYAALDLTLGRHPLALIRSQLEPMGVLTAAQISRVPSGRAVRAAGLVIARQRPSSANGVTFVTIEDETSVVNAVVWQRVAEAQRKALIGSRLLLIDGVLERDGDVQHLIASHLEDGSHLLDRMYSQPETTAPPIKTTGPQTQ